MEEKFKLIESKPELFAEIGVAVKRTTGTIQNHWFGKVWEIPDKYKELVESIIDKRIMYENACKKSNKQLHTKYFGN